MPQMHPHHPFRNFLPFMVLAMSLALACAKPAIAPQRPSSALDPTLGWTDDHITLLRFLPGWVNAATCIPGNPRPRNPNLKASVICGPKQSEPWPNGVGTLSVASWVVPRLKDDVIRDAESAWSINSPNQSAAPACVIGPWIGPWDDDGQVVGGLSCVDVDGSIEYFWSDDRYQITASVQFGGDWQEAYQLWRQVVLAKPQAIPPSPS